MLLVPCKLAVAMDLLESSSDEDSELIVSSFAQCSVCHSIEKISLQSRSKQNPQDQNISHVGKTYHPGFDETATLNDGKENNAKIDQNVSNCRRVDVGIRGLGCSTSNKSIIASQQAFLDSSLFESQSWHPVDRTLVSYYNILPHLQVLHAQIQQCCWIDTHLKREPIYVHRWRKRSPQSNSTLS